MDQLSQWSFSTVQINGAGHIPVLLEIDTGKIGGILESILTSEEVESVTILQHCDFPVNKLMREVVVRKVVLPRVLSDGDDR